MSAIDIEIRRRNARLRAWAKYGAPVEGRWVRHGSAVAVHVGCTICRTGQSDKFRDAPLAMAGFERKMIRMITVRGCAHLSSLLHEDPPEIQRLTRLELLAR